MTPSAITSQRTEQRILMAVLAGRPLAVRDEVV